MGVKLTRVLTSLTAKYVAVFVLLVAVPAIGISWYLLDSSYNDNKQALIRLQQSQAQSLASKIGQTLNDTANRLGTVNGHGLSASRLEDVLHPFLLGYANPVTAYYMNSRGEVAQASGVGALPHYFNASPPLGLSERQFRKAEDGPYFSPVVALTKTGGIEPGRFFDIANRSSDGSGVFGEKLSASIFQNLFSQSHGRYAYLVDSGGQPLAYPSALVAPASACKECPTSLERFSLPQVEQALSGRAGSGTAAGHDFTGRKVLSTWATVGPTHWKVFVEQPESAAFAPLSSKILKTALLIAAFVAAAVALSILLARRLVRPIKRMQVAAEAIGAGAYEERIDLERRDELGALARAFNQMAEHLQELIGGLERVVAERTRQLENASKHKSEFLANMSHELRTPLNAILGFTQVLQQKLFGEVNDKQEEYLGDIHSSADHLLELINDVLDLSKVEAGQVELEKTTFSLAEALERGVVMLRERASKNGVHLTLEPDPNVELITADERRIRQVVFNLLSNAVKFTPQGGSVDVRSAQENGEVLVSVADTGPGISAKDQERIFEEFQQTDIGAEQREGTGLGLALSKKLIELHGGRIWVESQVGEGSTFTFALPGGSV